MSDAISFHVDGLRAEGMGVLVARSARPAAPRARDLFEAFDRRDPALPSAAPAFCGMIGVAMHARQEVEVG